MITKKCFCEPNLEKSRPLNETSFPRHGAVGGKCDVSIRSLKFIFTPPADLLGLNSSSHMVGL